MPYFQGQPSLYDLLNPVELYGGGQQGYDNGYTGMPDNGDVMDPVRPTWDDRLADRLIGSDRYGELTDEARRRALGSGMMNLGQSLSAAAVTPSWAEITQILSGALPRAMQSFEGRLGQEQQYVDQGEDREFQREQRSNYREDRERSKEDREKELRGREEYNKAALSAVEDVERSISEISSTLPEGRAQILAGDLKAKIRLVKATAASGMGISEQQLNSVMSGREKLYDASPPAARERIDQQEAARLYEMSVQLKKPISEIEKIAAEQAGIPIKKAVVDMAAAFERLANEQREGRIGAMKETELNNLPPGERKTVLLGGSRREERPEGPDLADFKKSASLKDALLGAKTIDDEGARALVALGVDPGAKDEKEQAYLVTPELLNTIRELNALAYKTGGGSGQQYSPQQESLISQFIAEAAAAGQSVSRQFAIQRLMTKGLLGQ